MKVEPEVNTKNTHWLGIASILSAIIASACCVAPLVLLSLGIGGAWMSTLTSMETIRPFFIILTLLFIVAGFIKLYRNKNECSEEAICASNQIIAKQRLIFWIGSVTILILLAFPWYAPYFM